MCIGFEVNSIWEHDSSWLTGECLNRVHEIVQDDIDYSDLDRWHTNEQLKKKKTDNNKRGQSKQAREPARHAD